MGLLEKMGILKAEEPQVTKKNNVTPPINQPINIPTSPFPSAVQSEEFKKIFDKVLDDANIPGPDFFEFYRALEKNTSMIPDQDKYKNTFNTLETMGLTKEKLIAAGQHYIKALNDEEQEFNNTIEQKKKQIADKAAKINSLQEKNLSLQKEMMDNNTTISTLTTEISNDNVKVGSTQMQFKSDKDAFVNRISTVLNNIKTYLQ